MAERLPLVTVEGILVPCEHRLPVWTQSREGESFRFWWAPGTVPSCPTCHEPVCGVTLALAAVREGVGP